MHVLCMKVRGPRDSNNDYEPEDSPTVALPLHDEPPQSSKWNWREQVQENTFYRVRAVCFL